MTFERMKILMSETEQAIRDTNINKLISIGRELYEVDDLDLNDKTEWFESMVPPSMLQVVQEKVL